MVDMDDDNGFVTTSYGNYSPTNYFDINEYLEAVYVINNDISHTKCDSDASKASNITKINKIGRISLRVHIVFVLLVFITCKENRNGIACCGMLKTRNMRWEEVQKKSPFLLLVFQESLPIKRYN